MDKRTENNDRVNSLNLLLCCSYAWLLLLAICCWNCMALRGTEKLRAAVRSSHSKEAWSQSKENLSHSKETSSHSKEESSEEKGMLKLFVHFSIDRQEMRSTRLPIFLHCFEMQFSPSSFFVIWLNLIGNLFLMISSVADVTNCSR